MRLTGAAETTPDKQTLPRTRPELSATRLTMDGLPYWVIKDPMSLRYYRFNREEYFIIEQLRQGVTLDELKAAHQQEFRTDRLTNQDIIRFIQQLAQKSIVQMQHPHRDELLFKAAQKARRHKILGLVSNFMFVKVPLYDPDRLFNRLMPHIRWIWTKTFLLFYLALVALALGLIVQRWQDFVSMFQNHFLTIYNLPLLMVSIYLIKGLHEFGHGLTCKHYGGEVHEMGFLWLVFNPFFYCNVTDSWMFPNKWQRLMVTAGGVMTEVFFASLAVFVWYFTEPPGFVNILTFNIVISCAFSALMMNANPLLKYDGYYFLMDLIEIPNLQQRSRNFMKRFFVNNILGGDTGEMAEEHKFRYFFPLYSVAAYVYRWFIMFMILYGVYHIIGDLGLEWLARFVVVIAAGTMLLLPLIKGGTDIVKRREAMGISNVRLIIILAVLVALAGVVMLLPMEQTVTLSFVLEPEEMAWVRADVGGTLEFESELHDGMWLDEEWVKTQPVARQENHELPAEQIRLQTELEQVAADISFYRQQRMSDKVKQLQERQASLQKELAIVEELIGQLEIRAPMAGQVVGRDTEFVLGQGGYVAQGTPLFLVADTNTLNAKVWIPEKTWARIFERADRLGQDVELLLYAFSAQAFRGKVIAVSKHREVDMGEFGEKLALSNKVGGEVLTEFDPVAETEKPVEAVYEVTIALEQEMIPESARPYMSGRARISCGESTLYKWGWDSLLRYIAPEIRL